MSNTGTPESFEQLRRTFTNYAVERELGSGGMATVYLAHDRKHDRKVAIKVLHAELAAMLGADRFLQEIKLTANLQHPHILGLIDSGVLGDDATELAGRPYYVMPFIEGESLRQRLEREQQLPVADAVRIVTEIAGALDYAHRHGVIHRDIKPENILLHDNSAIVADFGIALAVTEAGGARMTQTGLSLGTPAYMSPEQAMGARVITARSDVYSLGAVLYELLAGEPPFTGPTVQAVVARVMTEEPRSLTGQRRTVPRHVSAAVSRVLEKLPADRFESALAFAEALNDPTFAGNAESVATAFPAAAHDRRMLYAASALAALFLATTLWAWNRAAPPKQVVRSTLSLDSAEGIALGAPWWDRLAIAPDGAHLAFIGQTDGQVFIRPRNQLRATPIPGSQGAETPFFSPDGAHIGFLSEGHVYIASINGGPPVAVSDTLTGVAGASWGRDGFIYVDGQGSLPLLRVEAKPGATPKWFTTLDTATGEMDHTWPDVLPNGKGVLFTIVFRDKRGANGGTSSAIGVADIPSGKHRILINGAIHARYAASGHLVYVTPGKTLMAVPFDQNSMKITGEPFALADRMRLGANGAADLAVSQTGTLVYATGGGEGKQELVWVTRDGKEQDVDRNWQGIFFEPALSPDGKRLAVAISTGDVGDVWIRELDRGSNMKLTIQGSANAYPTWTPDGRSITYSSNASSAYDLWTKQADGSAQAVLQLHQTRDLVESEWSPDGKWLVFVTDMGGPGVGDILGIRPGVDTIPVPLVATNFQEFTPTISPDGRWLAYCSNESGQYEIWVVPFPNTGAAKWAVSTHGGTEPRWSHSGRELFFRDGAHNLVAQAVNSGPTFSLGPATVLFPAAGYAELEEAVQYAVSRDDKRFLMVRSAAATTPDRFIVVENWFEELKGKPRK